jgi:hypothetical protein
MAKKVWRKPELRQIEAGGAEAGKINAAQDSKALPNTGS